ncbi:site-2 protease family protein [Sandaracinus amylolyticus]|nr:site-2 protease family protein [Sandaracinus amylolyticus]
MRFSLFGVPVLVRPAFWMVAALLASPYLQAGEWPLVATWVAIVLVSVLVHELGHAWAMRALGRSPRIELWAMGGLTHWGEGPRISGWKRAVVSLAGPTAGFALALPIAIAARWGAFEPGSLAHTAVDQALLVNLFYGALNLLPILPLDGGHVMEVALTSIFGAQGPRLARYASIALAVIAALVAMTCSVPGLAFIALFAGLHSMRALGAPEGDGSIPARAPIDPAVERAIEDAWDAIRGGREDDAIAACDAILERTPDDEASAPLRARLLETIAWAHLEAGREREASGVARRMPARFRPSALLAARLLLAEGKHDEGMQALERAWQDTPGDLPGLVLAAAHVDARQPERAVVMLRSLRGARLSTNAHLTISAALFYAEHYEHALAVSELAWNRFHVATHAYNAACSCARLGRIAQGLDWLAIATNAGFDDVAKLETDDDLAPLRADPRWREVTSARSSPR